MKIKTWIKYTEGYLPSPRHRKMVYKECEEYVDITLKEVSSADVSLAFKCMTKLCDEKYMEYISYKGKLYTKTLTREISCKDIENPLENLIWCNANCSAYFGFEPTSTKENVLKRAKTDMQKYILIDGVLYSCAVEPVYAVYCFGLGGNHASTCLSVTEFSLAKRNSGAYFSIKDRDTAIAYTLKVAARRGDTNSFESIKNTPVYQIYMPEMLKVRSKTNN